jgi:hypothetical protein
MSDLRPPRPPISPTRSGGNVVALGACLIAAVRLAREPELKHTPHVLSQISQSVSLAHRIYRKVKDDFPELF